MGGEMLAGSGGDVWDRQSSAAWPERFQDLASWCPLPQDELNTPQPLQDEFNFRIDGEGRDWDDLASPGAISGDLTGARSWETSEMLCQPGDMEENNSALFCPRTNGAEEEDKCRVVSVNASVVVQEECEQGMGQYREWETVPIRSGGNVLLSQGALRPQHRSLFSLLKSEEPLIDPGRSADKLNSSSYDHRPYTATSTGEPVIKYETLDLKKEKYAEEENNEELFKVPQMGEGERRRRPKLKLNITAANSNGTTSGTGQFVSTIDTPDVMRSLSDESAFDLLSFVNGDFDDPNVLTSDPTQLVAPALDAVKSDHDYTGADVDLVAEVKSEPQEDEEDGGTTEGGARGLKRRRSSLGSDEAYESPQSDDAESEDSQDWSPYKRRGKKRAGRGRGGRKTSSGSGTGKRKESGEEAGGQDRYRELRDRNNEASRKSRLNRKQKELEMGLLADNLEKENLSLKQKAESLERLVKKLREVLMNIVLKK